MNRFKPIGWKYEGYRHSLAARGIKTSFKLKYGKDIPAQLHTGSKEFKDISEVKQHLPFKPRGGFWTSSYRHDAEPGSKSDWLDWASSEMPGKASSEHMILRPIPNAKIFEIDDEEDMRYLFDKYGTLVSGMPDLDWQKLSQDYDGLRVTENAAHKFHLNYVSMEDLIKKKGLKSPFQQYGRDHFLSGVTLNAWDSESTIWFRDVFKKKTPVAEMDAGY